MRVIGSRMHGYLDYLIVFLPHLIFGIILAGAGLMTKTTPDYKRIFDF